MNGSTESESLSFRATIWTSVGAAVVLGLVEWAVIAKLGFSLRQGEACRTIIAIGILYGLFGLGLGIISSVFLAIRKLPASPVTLPAAVFAALAVLRLGRGPSLLTIGNLFVLAAALALGWVLHRIISRLVLTRPFFLRPQPWWTLQGFTLAAALILTTHKAPNTESIWIALAAAGTTCVLLIWSLRPGQTGLWKSAVATAMVLAACFILGFRVPIVTPKIAASSDRTSVLLITIDTLRADHVGAYGYSQARTPQIDHLAERGVLFREVVTPHRLTGPSHASILTGLMPEKHGVFKNMARMSKSIPTIAELLSSKGYVTASFVSSWTTVDSACGLPSHFQVYNDDIGEISWFPEVAYRITVLHYIKKALSVFFRFNIFYPCMYRTASRTTDAAVSWLERNNRYPFFIWVHFFDPHLPYRPPKEYVAEGFRNYKGPVSRNWYFLSPSEQIQIITSPENMKQMIALYDAEISYADHEVGRLVEATERMAPHGRLLTIVTADHGESMGEHHLYWGRDLYDPTLLVPLIMVPPDNQFKTPLVIKDQVRTIDIAPTILELLDVKPSKIMDGLSLVGLIKDNQPFQESAKSKIYLHNEEHTRPSSSIRCRGWKLIVREPCWDRRDYTWDDEAQELYNLKEDPSEEKNLASESSKELKKLRDELEEYRHLIWSKELDLTPDEIERLRSLGYIR
jgi:arylsulfatase A-like enzyme